MADYAQLLSPNVLRAIAATAMGTNANVLAGEKNPIETAYDVGKPVTDALGGHAYNALSEAYNNPTLPNIVNAGVNTALTVGNVPAALTMMGGGYGTAAALDFLSGSKANAADAADIRRRLDAMPKDALKALQKEMGVTADGVVGGETVNAMLSRETSREQKDAADRADKLAIEQARINAEAGAKVAANKARVDAETEKSLDVGRRTEAAKMGLFRDLTAARTPADDESYTGALYNKLGVLTPLVGGIAGGAAARIAKPVLGTGIKAIDNYVNPFLVGSELGGSLAMAPLYKEAYRGDPSNPEYRAWQTYKLALPSEAKDEVARADERLASVPSIDPSVTSAREDLKDVRMRGLAMLQGGLGGLVGNTLAGAAETIPDRVARVGPQMMKSAREAANAIPAKVIKEPIRISASPPQQQQQALPPPQAAAPAAPIGGFQGHPPVLPAQAQQVPPPAPPPANTPIRAASYGQSQKAVARTLVDSRVGAGLGVPTEAELADAMTAAGVKVPQTASYAKNVAATEKIVADMISKGASPQQVVAVLRWMRDQKMPILGIGGAVMAEPTFDQAMSQYRRLVVDMDGDGKPDAVIPVSASNNSLAN